MCRRSRPGCSVRRRAAERVADLERPRLLALEPERVHGVDERDRVLVREARGSSSSAWSKLPSISRTRAPWISVCASLPTATLPPRNEAPRRSGRPSPRTPPRWRSCCQVDAQTTGFEPSSTALAHGERHAAVLERTAVGLAPSNLSISHPAGGRRGSAACALVERHHDAPPRGAGVALDQGGGQ